MLLQHVKDPGHSAESAGGRLHLNTHTPLAQRSRSELTMLSKNSVAIYQGNELTRNSSGNTRSQSSQLAEPLWTDPGVKSGIVCASWSSLWKKKKKNAGGKWIAEPSPKIIAAKKKPRPSSSTPSTPSTPSSSSSPCSSFAWEKCWMCVTLWWFLLVLKCSCANSRTLKSSY